MRLFELESAIGRAIDLSRCYYKYPFNSTRIMVRGGFSLIAILGAPIFFRTVLCARSICQRVIIERIAKLELSGLPKFCRLHMVALARNKP